MKIKNIVSSASVGVTIVIGSVLLASCSCKITDEQLAKISGLRQEERAINSEITTAQSERAKTEKELQARRTEADDCNKKRETVKQRLNQWPNIWPDYTPNP